MGFSPLRPNQAQVLGNLNRVREMVTAEMSKLDQQRVNEFLNACCEGNEYRIKKVVGPVLCLQRTVVAVVLEEASRTRGSICVLHPRHQPPSRSLQPPASPPVFAACCCGRHCLPPPQNTHTQTPQMLHQGCDVNCTDYDQRTGLILAAGQGANSVVRKLLESGATVNAQDKLGGTALLEAVKQGHDSTIE